MNRVILIGRMSKDPETRQTSAGTATTRFTVAVDRRNREQGADFISCVAFNKTAEFISKYFKKGQRIGIVGRLNTGSYEKDGRKVYTTDVLVDEAEFVESKKDTQEPAYAAVEREQNAEGFMQMTMDETEGLPFN